MIEDDPKRRRWFQFRLKPLLIGVRVLSLPLSWFAMRMERARKQREAVEEIERLGGWTDDWVSSMELVLGRDGAPVFQASLSNTTANNTALRHICNLYYLEDLDLSGTRVTDAGVVCLTRLSHLHRVRLKDTQVTPEGVKNLQEALPNCRITY